MWKMDYLKVLLRLKILVCFFLALSFLYPARSFLSIGYWVKFSKSMLEVLSLSSRNTKDYHCKLHSMVNRAFFLWMEPSFGSVSFLSESLFMIPTRPGRYNLDLERKRERAQRNTYRERERERKGSTDTLNWFTILGWFLHWSKAF